MSEKTSDREPLLDEAGQHAADQVWRDAFNSFDRSGNGSIDEVELMDCLRELGFNVNRDGAHTLFVRMDTNSDNRVGFSEFVKGTHP